jgi:hypothetical protein
MCPLPGRGTVPRMDTEADRGEQDGRHLIQIELRLDGKSPTGRATAAGRTSTFSGWVGLVSAVDALVAEPADGP